MPVTIKYNNQEVLANQPVPLVTRQDTMVKYGERWCDASVITLQGQITGCPNNFDGLVDGQRQLIDIFGKDFQTLEIFEDGNLIHSKPYCIIREGVRFPSSNYNSILNYEVSIECYESGLFSGFYGVLDPVDSWSFKEENDRTITATHQISARGINTSSGNSNAFQNAIDFVASKTGIDSFAQPYFINLPSNFGVCLRSVRTASNRIEGIYGVDLTYRGDPYYNNGGILRYDTSANCPAESNLVTVSIKGQVEGCLAASILDVRNIYSSFDVLGVAEECYTGIANIGSLNLYPLSSGIIEEPSKPSLSFDVQFDNFTGTNFIIDYSASVNSGEDGIISVNAEATIKPRAAIQNPWTIISGAYNDFDLRGIAEQAYSDFGASDTLNSFPISSGVSFNRFAPEIKTTATWDDKNVDVSGFSFLEYTYNFTPSLEKIVAKPLVTDTSGPLCSSAYSILDMGVKNRCIFEINGNGRYDCVNGLSYAVSELRDFANSKFTEFCPNVRAVLLKDVVTTGTDSNITFNFGWSAESPNNVVVPRVNYEDVAELTLK